MAQFSRFRFVSTACVVVVVLAMLPATSGAQEPPTDLPLAAEPVPPAEPVPSTEPAPSTEPVRPAEPVPSTEPAPSTEPVPEKKGLYHDQPAFVTPTVNQAKVRMAKGKMVTVETELKRSIVEARSLKIREKRLNEDAMRLGAKVRNQVIKVEESQEKLTERVVASFQHGTKDPAWLKTLSSDDAIDGLRKQRFTESVALSDSEIIRNHKQLKAELDDSSLSLANRLAVIKQARSDSVGVVAESRNLVVQAGLEVEALSMAGDVFIPNVSFPIAGPYDRPLIDSWGFPRATGTLDEHWHEGIDLFAPLGSELVAAESGVVTRIGSGGLEGLSVRIEGESGASWYYAHLDSIASGLSKGQFVESGEKIGAVGDSGNAVGTPPHLHLEIRPNSGAPINPYPILAARSNLDIAEGKVSALDPEQL